MSGELTFRIWSGIASQIKEAGSKTEDLRGLLEPHTDGIVYVRQADGGGLFKGFVALWHGDARAMQADLESPPHYTGFLLREHETMPATKLVGIRIGDHLDDDKLIEGIRIRLRALAPYDPDGLPDFPDWHWYIADIYARWNLLVRGGELVLPQGWQINGVKIGPIFCRTTHVRLIDGRGRMGLMTQEGRVSLPCDFVYLGEPDCRRIVACEALREAMPAMLDPCNIVDTEGNQTNSPDVKILAGTLKHGIATAVRAADKEKSLKGYISASGELLSKIRWREVTSHWGDIAKVQEPETGLWGYVDDRCRLIIEEQFVRAGMFNHDFAQVEPEGADGKLGLIDKTGKLVVEAKWKDIDALKRGHFMVTAHDGAVGLIDRNGAFVVEPRQLVGSELEQFQSGASSQRHPFNKLLDDLLRAKVEKALEGSETLAPLAGIFDNAFRDRDLMACGVWGMSVTVIANRDEVDRMPLRAGDRGNIGWTYPASGSIFDLSIEAPVEGMSVLPHGSVGVPWRLLRRVE